MPVVTADATDSTDIELAIRLHRQGSAEEARAIYNRILDADPNNSDALNLLGAMARQNGQLLVALKYLLRAVDADETVALYHANLGAVLTAMGRYEDAVVVLEICLTLDSDNVAGLINLADAYNQLERFSEAEIMARRGLIHVPRHSDLLNNLGISLAGQKHRQQARDIFAQVLDAQPDHADTWNSLGVLLLRDGDVHGAIEALRESVRCAPGRAEAHFGLGICLLTSGDFEEGAREYEWRWGTRDLVQRNFDAPKWDGEELGGKTLLLYAEQGFGDVIQFIRFAPILADMGARVVIEVPPQLVGLVTGVQGVSAIVAIGDPLPPIDCHAPLLSLMALLDLRVSTIPGQVPYLKPSREIVAAWSAKLTRPDGKFKVGLVWAGNPGHRNDANRSMNIDSLAPLFDLPDVAFYSLQVGGDPRKAGASALSKYPMIEDLAPQLTDFGETAGALSALDLLITVDTGVAHLAGALARPVWVAVPMVPDWRWMVGRDDSPWYPTMRLFRQKTEGAWPGVIELMVARLRGLGK